MINYLIQLGARDFDRGLEGAAERGDRELVSLILILH